MNSINFEKGLHKDSIIVVEIVYWKEYLNII